MKRIVLASLLLTLTACAENRAVEPTEQVELDHPVRVPGSIERALVPPHVVLAHDEELQLSSTQRSEITEHANTARARLSSSNAELDRTTEVLRLALAASPIDEEAAIQAARDVSAVEDDIKLEHLRMLVRVQNALTASQRESALSLPPR